MVIKGLQGTVHKFSIGHDGIHQLRQLAGIGQVTAALAGDKELLTQLFIAFKQVDAGILYLQSGGSHHTGCTAADNHDLLHYFSPSVFMIRACGSI